MATEPDVVRGLRADLPRPDGPFRVLEPEEAVTAFVRARDADRALHAEHGELDGFEIIEVKPVILGGDPADLDNKRAVDWATHRELIDFWRTSAPELPGELASAPPAPDHEAYAEPDQHVILKDGGAYVVLWPLEAVGAVTAPGGAPVFGTDGSGTAYVWAAGGEREGVYALPAIPLDPRLARYVGRTVSDLVDADG